MKIMQNIYTSHHFYMKAEVTTSYPSFSIHGQSTGRGNLNILVRQETGSEPSKSPSRRALDSSEAFLANFEMPTVGFFLLRHCKSVLDVGSSSTSTTGIIESSITSGTTTEPCPMLTFDFGFEPRFPTLL